MSKNAGDFGRLWSSGGDKQKTSIPEPGHLTGPPPMRTSRNYVAFEAHEHAQRLHIRCATQPSRYPAYSCLLDIIYDHDFGKTFTLVYSFMMVEVTGHHLGAIVQAIAEGNCERIREFHHKLYDAPDPVAPVIETVTITVANGN